MIEGEKSSVPNIVSSGLLALPTPLREYNEAFKKLQKRRQMIPLIGHPAAARHSESSTLVSGHSHSPITNLESHHTPHISRTISNISHMDLGPEDGSSSESEAEEAEYDDLYNDGEDELLPRESEEDVELYID